MKEPNSDTGLTKAAGWQIGVRRTLPVAPRMLWDFLLSREGLAIWLGAGNPFEIEEGSTYQLNDGTCGEIRVISPGSHWRITRQPRDPAYKRASTIQVRVIGKGEKSVLAFHEEHLPDQHERESRRDFYLGVFQKIKVLLGY